MTDVPHMGLSAVEKAINPPTTIAEQMDALIEQLERANSQAQRVLKELELIKRAIGT